MHLHLFLLLLFFTGFFKPKSVTKAHLQCLNIYLVILKIILWGKNAAVLAIQLWEGVNSAKGRKLQTSQPWGKSGYEKFKPPINLHAAGKPSIVHVLKRLLNNILKPNNFIWPLLDHVNLKRSLTNFLCTIVNFIVLIAYSFFSILMQIWDHQVLDESPYFPLCQRCQMIHSTVHLATKSFSI